MITANRRVPFMAGAAALVLIVIWYLALWSPQAKNVHVANKARAAVEQHISQLNSQVGQLQALVKQIPADKARFAQLATAVPDNPQIDQALNLLHQAAVSSGVVLATVGPSLPVGAAGSGSKTQSSGAPYVTLSLGVQGTAGQVKAFLAALAGLPRTVVVDRVSVTTGKGSSATISARIFYAGQPTP
ncbi:MAG TPA: type 4a pilus biogenesis protein PilO [Acidimicrobiales bacterium]|nr:type 4a pilus biogenesis protein PilO [Acidimicrobiales bacterium]